MTIHKSPYHNYRIKKVTLANGNENFEIQYKRKSIFAEWRYDCTRPTEELAMEHIKRTIKDDNEKFNQREVKEEYL